MPGWMIVVDDRSSACRASRSLLVDDLESAGDAHRSAAVVADAGGGALADPGRPQDRFTVDNRDTLHQHQQSYSLNNDMDQNLHCVLAHCSLMTRDSEIAEMAIPITRTRALVDRWLSTTNEKNKIIDSFRMIYYSGIMKEKEIDLPTRPISS